MKSLPANVDVLQTADSSPTLHWRRDDGYGEKMHHSGGAFSESVYIYDAALVEALARAWPARLISLGLGLGYNELLAIARLGPRTGWKIWSFEAANFLREGFAAWLEGGQPALGPVYDQVLDRVAAFAAMDRGELRAAALGAWRDGRLELRASFPEDRAGVNGATCIFYDAFSKKMNAELWREETLTQQLGELIAPQCVLATYAATGALNRALKALGFSLRAKRGFLGKRQSTLAIRG